LDKAAEELKSFAKTGLLQPDHSEKSVFLLVHQNWHLLMQMRVHGLPMQEIMRLKSDILQPIIIKQQALVWQKT